MKPAIKIAALVLAAAFAAGPALAADLVVKAKPAPAPVPASVWDIAFGALIASDYNFRGISQSDRHPSASAYFEPRLKIMPNVELYAGVAAYSVKLPTAPTTEVDFYGGIRPTIGPIAFDFGAIYYYYSGESQVFVTATGGPTGFVFPTTQPPAGYVPWTKADTDFWEVYGKATWTANDWLTVGGYVYYSPDWLNTGADGTYFGGTVKLTAPSTWLPSDWGAHVSGEAAHYILGRTDVFFGNVELPDYTYWNVGIGVTYKVFTLDLRYHDTDATQAECFALTGDLDGLDTGRRPGRSRWCGETFIAKLSVDTTLNALK